jgi:uncharacterized membrane protein YdfJ with MMPL/SSD domain
MGALQGFMDRLAGFLERRRWPVLAAWLLLLLAALPFAAKQTDHLTNAGFEGRSARREPALDLGS